MMMSHEEIVRSYKNAKSKSKQIGILADLNATTKEEIKKILLIKGVELPKAGRPKKEVATPEPKPEPKQEPVAKVLITGAGNKAIPAIVRQLSQERLSEIAVKIDYHRDRITELECERNELKEYLG